MRGEGPTEGEEGANGERKRAGQRDFDESHPKKALTTRWFRAGKDCDHEGLKIFALDSRGGGRDAVLPLSQKEGEAFLTLPVIVS